MKAISKITVALAAAAMLIAGCSGQGTAKATPVKEVKPAPMVSEESLGLRKTDIYNESGTAAEKTEYRTADAGTSTKIKRAYQDAPPMIPHNVSDFLPITKDNNACLGCHMPVIASAMGATPIPSTHFLDMRPHHKWDGTEFSKVIDNMKNQTDVKQMDHLSYSRFNCSQCHAPQSQGNLAVENTFEANYTKKDGEYKSDWKDVVLDDLDTVGKDSNVTSEDIANKNSPAGESVFKHQH
ncbi:MAG: nitrate reductase cytochrome c-type subunit [Helicobacteraceae bacterium]|jgi:cytochrome c-type protein NapB|nr:nitrate reductase cytochrome c-type subunit [Helicobacteraceae bacterium]